MSRKDTVHGEDVAAAVCASLVARSGVTCKQLAHSLGVPPLVIESCIRHNASTVALRHRLWMLMHTESEIASRVEPHLLHALDVRHAKEQRANTANHAYVNEQSATSGAGVATPHTQDEGALAPLLDSRSWRHFAVLQETVGQNFITILNNAGTVMESGPAWGSWLSSKLYEAFDASGIGMQNGGGGSVASLSWTDTARFTGDALREIQLAADREGTALLSRHLFATDLAEYTRLVSTAYQINRQEGHSPRREYTSTTQQHAHAARNSVSEGDMRAVVWPTEVPRVYFTSTYRGVTELDAIDTEGITSSQFATDTGSGAASTHAVPSGGMSHVPDSATNAVIAVEEFARYVDALESRMKVLRRWQAAVEECLYQHVQYRLTDFFNVSRRYGVLGEEAHSALAEVRVMRGVDMVQRSHFVAEMLRVAAHYRRRSNLEALHAVLTQSRDVLAELSGVENWAALPERDMAELVTVVRQLLQLERFLRHDGDRVEGGGCDDASGARDVDAASDTSLMTMTTTAKEAAPPMAWAALSGLRCLSNAEQRVATARQAVERLVRGELLLALDAEGAAALLTSETWPRTAHAAEGALLLGVLVDALRDYAVTVVRVLWSRLCELVTSLLMSSGALSDARANELLSHAGASGGALSVDARRAFFVFCNDCNFAQFVALYAQLIDGVVEALTATVQRWGFFTVQVLWLILSSSDNTAVAVDNRAKLVRLVTGHFLSAVCGEAEEQLALCLECYAAAHTTVMSGTETERLVTLGLSSVAQLAELPRQLEAVLPDVLTDVTRAVKLGRTMQLVCRKTMLDFFRAYHANRIAELTVELETEPWVAVEAIEATHQAHAEYLCTSDPAVLRRVAGRSVEAVGRYAHGRDDATRATAAVMVASDVVSPPATSRGEEERQRRGEGRKAGGEAGAAEGGPRSGPSQKLYVSLREEATEGRVVTGSLLFLVELLYEYNQYLERFPSLAFDVVAKQCEALEFYDARTAKLVLGASAIEKGTLRTITTTHLCLASQSVAFLADFAARMQTRLLCLLCNEDAGTEGAKREEKTSGASVVGVETGDWATDEADPALSASRRGVQPTTATAKLRPFIRQNFDLVVRNCLAHRNDCFHKIAVLVESKVDSLGFVETRGEAWTARGNEWVMTMLREVARLMRTLRPLLPARDVHGVVAPLLGSLALKIREVTRTITERATDTRSAAAADVLLFKANVEKFGYDVLRCAAVQSVKMATETTDFAPRSSDEDVLRWFFPPIPPTTTTPVAPTAVQPSS